MRCIFSIAYTLTIDFPLKITNKLYMIKLPYPLVLKGKSLVSCMTFDVNISAQTIFKLIQTCNSSLCIYSVTHLWNNFNHTNHPTKNKTKQTQKQKQKTNKNKNKNKRANKQTKNNTKTKQKQNPRLWAWPWKFRTGIIGPIYLHQP